MGWVGSGHINWTHGQLWVPGRNAPLIRFLISGVRSTERADKTTLFRAKEIFRRLVDILTTRMRNHIRFGGKSSSFYLPNNITVCTSTLIQYYLFWRARQQGPKRTLTVTLKRLIKQLLGTYSTRQAKYYKQTRKLVKSIFSMLFWQFSLVCHLICDIISTLLCRNCIAIILFSISIMCGHCNLVNSVNHNNVG